MLGAIRLWGFRQDDGAAVAHEQVGRHAQSGVGGHAGITVGPTTLQCHNQFAGGHGHARYVVGFGQRVLHEFDARHHGLAAAAHLLNIERL